MVPGKRVGKLAQEARVGAGEGVDGLRGVADDAQLVAPAEPQVEQRRLQRGDVLELVDDEALVLPAHLGGDPLVVGEQPGGEEQDVLHVHAALAALDVLVGGEHARDRRGVEIGDGAAARRREPGVVVGVDVADLGPLDLGGEVAQQRLVGVDAHLAGGEGEHRQLGLGQRGQLGAGGRRPEVAQLAQRGGVEGASLHPGRAQRAQPPAHLAGGAGGEGHGEHLGGLVDAGGHAVRDPVGDRAGLAGAGPGQHPHRAAQRLGDASLLGVEGREELVGGGHRGTNTAVMSLDRRRPDRGAFHPRPTRGHCPR